MIAVSPSLDRPTPDAVAAELRAVCVDRVVERHHPLGPLTTYRVGGAADLFIDVASERDLFAIADVVSRLEIPIAVIGRGSNLLVADSGYPGLVVHLGTAFDTTTELGTGLVRIGGAAALPVVARQLTAAGHTGFEWAVGVPGSLGGAVRMNAGGHGSDMAHAVRSVRVVDLRSGEAVEVDRAGLDFGYRSSSVQPHEVVVGADLELPPGDPERGQAMLREIVAWRREHQPGGQNAGSCLLYTSDAADESSSV